MSKKSDRIRERWATARWAWCESPASRDVAHALSYLADPETTAKIAALPADIRTALAVLRESTRALLILIDQAADDVDVLLMEQDDAHV